MLEPSPQVTASLYPQPAPPVAEDTVPLALVRVAQSARRVDTWMLVLTSKGIRSLSQWEGGAFALYVLESDFAQARTELDAADAEEREAARARRTDAAVQPPPARRYAGAGALLVSLLLLAFFAVTGPRAGGSHWFVAGAADAEQVLHGQWWRAVTALTLHADSAHVVGNVGLGTLVVGAVMRSEGIGWGAALVLAAGTTGNLINAWVHHSLHSSVGFSTAVFGAVGLLGALAYAQRKRRLRTARTAWTALAGSFALLALLGTGGQRTDLLAHLFGLMVGVVLGFVTTHVGGRAKGSVGQWLAGSSALASVVGAWLLALR